MVGLSVVLEGQRGVVSKNSPQVINKTMMLSSNGINKQYSPSGLLMSSTFNNSHHSTFMKPTFLDLCFLCRNKLLPGKDIYMYKGDKAFCSVECRCKQIFMDEEESIQKENCSFAAMRPTSSSTASSSASSSSSHRKGTRNDRHGGFAY